MCVLADKSGLGGPGDVAVCGDAAAQEPAEVRDVGARPRLVHPRRRRRRGAPHLGRVAAASQRPKRKPARP